MLEVHDKYVGKKRFTLVTDRGRVEYIQLDGSHMTTQEFETMYQIYLDFEETDDE